MMANYTPCFYILYGPFMLVQIVIYEYFFHRSISPLIDSRTPTKTPNKPINKNQPSFIGIASNPLLYIDTPTVSTLIKKGETGKIPAPHGD
tara:strand:- start:747 stop:1019 length:273 start_codon:yes stop_codon:yes gene_type:complete